MFRKMVGRAFLMAGLAAIAASSGCGSRASCGGASKPAGAPGAPGVSTQVPRRNRKRGTRPTPKPSTPPEVNLAKILDGLKANEHFKDSAELAAMQAKVEQALEADDNLAKRQARTPEVAVHSVSSALQNRKAMLTKTQAKVVELEAAAKAAAEAVDEAKQKARLATVGKGSLLGLCWRRARVHQNRHRQRRTIAGPELLVKQMETWLPLRLDGRRAAAKQLADQEEVGEPLPRPSLEEVDDVCKTYKSMAGLGHDCINPKAVLQMPVELRVRFIDLLVAFEAKLVKRLCWAHMMVLRPKPSGSHNTLGLTVSPLRVLSRLRRPLAQKWENDHDAAYFWGCQGKACDRAAWVRSIVVAAAKGRQQSAASLSLDLAKFNEHVGHDHFPGRRGDTTSFPRRLLASWRDSYEGWRFLEADKCATFPFLGLRDHSSQAAVAPPRQPRLMLATLLETVASRLPAYKLWNVSTTFRGTLPGPPGRFRSSLPKRPGSWWRASRRGTCRFLRASPKFSSTARASSSSELLRQLDSLGIDKCDTARNVGSDLQLGKRRRALVVRERLGRAARRTKRARQLRKAGARTRNLNAHRLECWGALGFGGFGLHPNAAQSHQSLRG